MSAQWVQPALALAAIGFSVFSLITYLWLGLTTLLMSERRSAVTWIGGSGLLFGALFFLCHGALVAAGASSAPPATTDLWWRLSWAPAFAAPLLWAAMGLRYTALSGAWQRLRAADAGSGRGTGRGDGAAGAAELAVHRALSGLHQTARRFAAAATWRCAARLALGARAGRGVCHLCRGVRLAAVGGAGGAAVRAHHRSATGGGWLYAGVRAVARATRRDTSSAGAVRAHRSPRCSGSRTTPGIARAPRCWQPRSACWWRVASWRWWA